MLKEKNGMCIFNGTQSDFSVLSLTESLVIAENQQTFVKVELVVPVTSFIWQPNGIFRHSFLKAYSKKIRFFLQKLYVQYSMLFVL